jgi:hypothetical protein
MQLNAYMKQLTRFLHDQRQEVSNPLNQIEYINKARRETAMRAQCVRRLTPVSGQVVSANVVAPGSGYTLGATLAISTPDFAPNTKPFPLGSQATGSAFVQNGTIAGAVINDGGAGYFQPTGSIVAAAGSGASITFSTSPINLLNLGQEVYAFSDIDLTLFPGVDSVCAVKSLSVIFANARYTLPCYAFSVYQAMIRTYPLGFYNIPAVCSQYGQGTDGSFYVYPPPAQSLQSEWDCFCVPQDLETNDSLEVIPRPWDDPIPYFAAHLAFADLQNFNASKFYLDLYNDFMIRHSGYARPGRAVNQYGRY